MKRLLGKVCVVTGGCLGIGRACALRMAAEGAHVAIFDQLRSEGRALVRQMAAQGAAAEYWQVDVAREHQVAKAMHEVEARFGSIDVPVNLSLIHI